MASIQVICPFCGATIAADTNNPEMICNYCGKSIIFGQNNANDPYAQQQAPDPQLIKEYNEKLAKWKQNSIIFSIFKAALSLLGWICLFATPDYPVTAFSGLAVSLILFIVLPLIIASKYPDGSNIPNANIKRTSKVKIAIEFYLLYFFISVVCFFIGAIMLLRN